MRSGIHGRILLCAVALSLLAAACVPPPPVASGTPTEQAMATEIFAKVNAERAARGLPAYAWDGQLAGIAAQWAAEMSRSGFRHRDLGSLFGDPAFDRWWGLGENIFTGSAPVFTSGDAHLAWMHSGGHRANVLEDGFDAVGIGVYCAPDGRTFAVQNFGRANPNLPPMGGATPPVDPIVSDDSGTRCSG